MTTRKSAIALLTLACGIPALIWSLPGGAAPGDPGDPGSAPIPTYDYGSGGKSFLVGLDFTSTSAALVGARVGSQPSYSHLGDPPLLSLRLLNPDGSERSRLNSWDPRWVFVEANDHGEQMVLMDRRDTLTLPFDADASSLVVHDNQAGATLATVDLEPAVHSYCVDNPSAPECLSADLAITDLTASSTPLAVIGSPVNVTVTSTAANLGPDSPIDATGVISAAGSTGLTVAPADLPAQWPALTTGSPQTREDVFSATCTQAGSPAVTSTATIAPEAAKVVDPVTTNDSRTTTLTLTCAIPVKLNVRPGNSTNQVNLNSGVLPMAVLSTAAGQYGLPMAFDATTIDATTLRFGTREAMTAGVGGTPEAHSRIHPEDSYEPDEVTRDGDTDAVVHARSDKLGVTKATTEVCVRGLTTTGLPFFGCDHVVVR